MATLAIWSPRVIYTYTYICIIYLKPQMSMFAVNPEALSSSHCLQKSVGNCNGRFKF